MKKLFCVLLSLLIALPILTFGGCANPPVGKPADDITVVFVPKVTENAFFEAANRGAQAYAQRHGFQVAYRGNPEADVSHQLEEIRQAVQEKADAICISSLDITALDDDLKAAMKAGIKVVTWDSDVSGDARTLMVSQGTPEQLGQMLVEMGAKSLIARGKSLTEEPIRYAWHYSQASVTDQNSWYLAGEKYIQANYPNWVNVAPENYYSQQNPQLAATVGAQLLTEHSDVDLIICNDSTALPGQAQALQDQGLTASDITVTGFASPNSMRDYCKAGVIERWGLWDCQVQGALGCYLAYYLASGGSVKVGDRLDVPEIGLVEVMPNTVLDPGAYKSNDSGVVLLPHRTEFTIDNVDDFDF